VSFLFGVRGRGVFSFWC